MTKKEAQMIDLKMIEKMAKLPAPLQDKMLERMEGALMAMEYLDQQHSAGAGK